MTLDGKKQRIELFGIRSIKSFGSDNLALSNKLFYPIIKAKS